MSERGAQRRSFAIAAAGPTNIQVQYGYYSTTGDERLETINNESIASGTTNVSQFNYGYDSAGDVTSWAQQSGTNAGVTYQYGYDGADQLLSVAKSGTGSESLIDAYAYLYDPAGNRTTEQIDSSVTTSAYNNLNQMTSRSGGGLLTVSGSLNEPGIVTVGTAAPYVTGSADTGFSTQVSVVTGSNNIPITAANVNGSATTGTLSVNVTSGTAISALQYDLNGNLTYDGTFNYVWDSANRLVKIWYGPAGSSASTTMTYDGLGRRAQIVEIGSSGTVTSTKNLVWDALNICEEKNASDVVTKAYFPQGVQISGSNYYYTRDHLGSIRELLDANGVVRAQYDYDPYGRQTQISGTMSADFGFTGLYYHQTSGLNLTMFRAYSPSLGRWISRDPLGEKGGINLYGYVGNNPISRVDPLGEWYVLNPVTWFNGSGYEGVSGGWDAYDAVTADAFREGAYAALDGIDPFGTPFADNGFYSPCDEGAQISQGLGTFARNAALVAVIPNIAEWSQNPLLYEIGQTTISPDMLELVGDMSAIGRGQILVDEAGGSYLGAMFGTEWGQIGNTIGTGLTPGGWLLLGGAAAWGDAQYKTH